MTLKTFIEKFNDLDINNQISLFNEYCDETNQFDDKIYIFDDETFEILFETPMEAARAVYFGDIKLWNDEWLILNGEGNLVSMTDKEAYEHMSYYNIEEIFEHKNIWSNYIDDDDDDDDNEYEE